MLDFLIFIYFFFRLFMEILNECLDVDEIKFQEDGTWCPMRPKKEALKVSSPCSTKIESEHPSAKISVGHSNSSEANSEKWK